MSTLREAHQPGASILVVDDNQDVREGLCDFLVSEGFLVESATDGADALERLKNVHEPADLPDVVLLDLRMPRMDGYEFLQRREADALLRKVPVIVVSATAAERKIPIPVTATLSKPVNTRLLLDLLRRQIVKHHA